MRRCALALNNYRIIDNTNLAIRNRQKVEMDKLLQKEIDKAVEYIFGDKKEVSYK